MSFCLHGNFLPDTFQDFWCRIDRMHPGIQNAKKPGPKVQGTALQRQIPHRHHIALAGNTLCKKKK